MATIDPAYRLPVDNLTLLNGCGQQKTRDAEKHAGHDGRFKRPILLPVTPA
jgi:hypothetical protein